MKYTLVPGTDGVSPPYTGKDEELLTIIKQRRSKL
jgi:hypothetical protein